MNKIKIIDLNKSRLYEVSSKVATFVQKRLFPKILKLQKSFPSREKKLKNANMSKCTDLLKVIKGKYMWISKLCGKKNTYEKPFSMKVIFLFLFFKVIINFAAHHSVVMYYIDTILSIYNTFFLIYCHKVNSTMITFHEEFDFTIENILKMK